MHIDGDVYLPLGIDSHGQEGGNRVEMAGFRIFNLKSSLQFLKSADVPSFFFLMAIPVIPLHRMSQALSALRMLPASLGQTRMPGPEARFKR